MTTIDDRDNLIKYIEGTLVPREDEKLLFGEVFTPMKFVEHMLDLLSENYKERTKRDIFSEIDFKWLDPANGIGNFPIAIFYRLMTGLSSQIEDPVERKRHILENMLYVCEINESNTSLYREFFQSEEYDLNIYESDFFELDPEEVFDVPVFDVVLGNPPYQKPGKGGGIGGSSPIYNKFIERSLEISRIVLYITPSRWFSGGKGLESFRNDMLNSGNIVFIEHYRNSKDVFSHVNIAGGVSVIYIDTDYNGDCKFIDSNSKKEIYIDLGKFDVISDPQYIHLIERFINTPSLESISRTRNLYAIETNGTKKDRETKIKYTIFLDNPTDTTVLCHTSKKYDFIQYVERDEICDSLRVDNLDKLQYWKVITGKTGNKKNFGRTLICRPEEVHSNSYLSFTITDENEGKSLMSYLKCRLTRVMLGLRKTTQDISPEKCKWVPLVPFDREWDDKTLESYFELSPELVELISDYCNEYEIESNEEDEGIDNEKKGGKRHKQKDNKKLQNEKKEVEISFNEITAVNDKGDESTLTENDLLKMAVSRLKSIAELNHISLKGLKVKLDIVRKITTNDTVKI